MYSHITPWNLLPKKLIWSQLGDIKEKHILDFGSGEGITANYLAEKNNVIAVEPNKQILGKRLSKNKYKQIYGGVEALFLMEDKSFDIVVCHNVLEYIEDRKTVYKEFERLLKPGGIISLVKHNKNGRIMQMVVLLNNFKHANELLNGLNGNSKDFGTIGYYDNDEILKYTSSLSVQETFGVRTFWHLQQNQEIHEDMEWQNEMLAIEEKVSQINDFQNISFFHHIILKKNSPV